MKILFDECVPIDLRKSLPGHQIISVTEQGWAGIKNGQLLALASKEFDVFLTVDKNLSFQQNIAMLPIATIVVHCHSNKVKHLSILMPHVISLLDSQLEKQIYRIGL